MHNEDEALGGWLSRRLAARGCHDVRIRDLSAPDAGYSGKTIFVTASWIGPDGAECLRELVFRVQVPDKQLFVAPDALRQAQVMSALAGQPGVPVPGIWFTEADPEALGAPFYVMTKVAGTAYRTAAQLEAVGAERTRVMSTRMINTLSDLHAVQPGAVGLDDFGQAAFEGYAAFDPFRYKFFDVVFHILEIAVARAMGLRHGPQRSHAAVRLV